MPGFDQEIKDLLCTGAVHLCFEGIVCRAGRARQQIEPRLGAVADYQARSSVEVCLAAHMHLVGRQARGTVEVPRLLSSKGCCKTP